MARLLAFLMLFCAGARLGAQHHSIDSLRTALEKTDRGTVRVDVLNELSYLYFDYDPEAGLKFASEAYELATDLSYSKGLQSSLTLQGFYYSTIGDFRQAIRFYRKSDAIQPSDAGVRGYNSVMTANAYRRLASYDSSESAYRKAFDILNDHENPVRLAFAYKSIAQLYIVQWKNDSARAYLDRAMDIYKARNHRYGMADTWFWFSELSKNTAEYAAAAEYVKQGCAISSGLDDEFLHFRCLVSEGDVQSQLGKYTDALKKYFEALGFLRSANNQALESSLYSHIADVYRLLGQNEIAWKYYTQALEIASRIGIRFEMAQIYIGMAGIFKNQGNFPMAHDYVQKSLALRVSIADEQGISNCYNIDGTIYYYEEKYEEAIVSLNRALEIRRRLNHREGIAACLYNLSLVFTAQGQLTKALDYQRQGLAIEEEIANAYNTAFSHNTLGSIYTKLKNYKQAEMHLKKAAFVAQQADAQTLLMQNNLNWAQFYEAQKKLAPALAFYKRYSENRDSIYSDIGSQKLAELQALFMMEQKDQEIRLLNQEQQLSQNEIDLQRAYINRQQIIILSVVMGLVLVSLLAFKTYQFSRRIQKANKEITEQKEEIQTQSEELREANETIAEINRKLETKIGQRTEALSQAYKELDTFFYRSSHDFRRPLTTFMGLAEVAKVTVKDANALELFDKVKETASNLDKMLIKLQSISDMGSQQLVFKEVMLKEIFETVCDIFREELHRKHIKTVAEVSLRKPFMSYPAMIRIIIENLVENAIYFSGTEKPYIRLIANETSGYINIEIQDNGQGISKDYQQQVFDMYFRGNERSKGNGLGLYIVKKAVERLNGSITLSSIPMVGSTFTIMLPNRTGE